MTVTRKDLRDDEILRFLRFVATESAAATFTEVSQDTQLSIDRGLIWLIHFIELYAHPSNVDDPAQNAEEYLVLQITRESQSAVVLYNDADLIEMVRWTKDRTATIGTDAGPVVTYDHSPVKYEFDPAIAYAAQNIYIGVQSSSASAQSVYGRIGYTLRRVTDKFFYRVAQALIS